MRKENSDIVKDYQKKIKLIKKHNKLYYNSDSPLVSDSEYDKLKNQGAQFIDNYGWEKPKWFSSNNEKENYSYKRNNSFKRKIQYTN